MQLKQTFVALFLLAFSCLPCNAEANLQADVESLFAKSNDILATKLQVDQIVDAEFDPALVRHGIDQMMTALQTMVLQAQPRNAHQRLKILTNFYYKPGLWNGHRPFVYDLDDPFGKVVAHKTFAHYLKTRRGNCVTMPILFVILGRSIGLRLTLADAPRHLFVRFTDETGKVWNLETTSGAGYTRTSHYRKHLPMTDRAVEAGLYLRSLNEDEIAGEIATTAVEAHLRAGRAEAAILVADAILKRNPKSVYAMVARGSAFALILHQQFLPRINSLDSIEAALAQAYSNENERMFKQAESMGWTESDGLPERWPTYQPKAGEE